MNTSHFKCLILAISIALPTIFCQSQTNWNFAAPTDGAGTANAETGRALCADGAGNIYAMGTFNGLADLDLSLAGVNTYSSSTTTDGYIVSYDKNGNFRWKTLFVSGGNDFSQPGLGIATDGTDIWFAGHVNTASSPNIISASGSAAITITAGGGGTSDILVGKLSCSTGNPTWLRVFGGTGNNDLGEAICIDATGACYIMGAYSSGFTYATITVPAPVGISDVILAKFDTNGNIQWITTGGGSGADMIANGAGIAYVPGTIPTLVAGGSFQTAPGLFGSFSLSNAGGHDMVLLELVAATGAITNAIATGTASTDELMAAVYDPVSKDVIVGGYYGATAGGSITLPGLVAAFNFTSAGSGDIVIGRYSVAQDKFVWAKSAGGSGSDRLIGMASDGLGGIHLTGFSQSNPCTFHSGFSVNAGSGFDDIIAAKYDYNGNTLYALAAGQSTGSDDGRGIACYVQASPALKHVFITGNFQGTISFGAQTPLVADGGNDFFVARINDATSVLPSRPIIFSGRRTDDATNTLAWEIANDVDAIRSFTLERSIDGTTFSNINIRLILSATRYTYDDRPVYGTAYYRLRTEDRNDRISYSPVLRIGGADNTDPVAIFPNPVQSSFQLHVPNDLVNTKAVLATSAGVIIKTVMINASNTIIDVSDLSAGIYYLKLDDGQVLKLMKNK